MLIFRPTQATLNLADFEALKEFMAGSAESVPGCVGSIQTLRVFLTFYPRGPLNVNDTSLFPKVLSLSTLLTGRNYYNEGSPIISDASHPP
jgi:hypothetical protein